VDHEPAQPAEDSLASYDGRMARFRKFNGAATTLPLLWHECVTGAWGRLAQEFYQADDILLKFSSAFVKQPRVGAETPWVR